MGFMKKAQGATEYLIILAVVIIIALIVVGVMGGIPGIGGAAGSRSSASFFTAADVAISSYNNGATTDLSLNIRNNKQSTITITVFNVNSVDVHGATDITLNPGQSTTLTSADAGIACIAGNSFSFPVSVTYTENGADYTYAYDGNKLEGTCAN